LLQDPFNQDPNRILRLEIEKGENFEKKKKSRSKFRKISEANIEDEVRQMAFLLGIYSGGGPAT
jgi:hypothetical protein